MFACFKAVGGFCNNKPERRSQRSFNHKKTRPPFRGAARAFFRPLYRLMLLVAVLALGTFAFAAGRAILVLAAGRALGAACLHGSNRYRESDGQCCND